MFVQQFHPFIQIILPLDKYMERWNCLYKYLFNDYFEYFHDSMIILLVQNIFRDEIDNFVIKKLYPSQHLHGRKDYSFLVLSSTYRYVELASHWCKEPMCVEPLAKLIGLLFFLNHKLGYHQLGINEKSPTWLNIMLTAS